MGNTTQIIHSIPVYSLTGAVPDAFYQTSTFMKDAPGVNKRYDYAGTGTPTRQTSEKIVAGLEEGKQLWPWQK